LTATPSKRSNTLAKAFNILNGDNCEIGMHAREGLIEECKQVLEYFELKQAAQEQMDEIDRQLILCARTQRELREQFGGSSAENDGETGIEEESDETRDGKESEESL
ncbi:hypothetical protein KEM55_002452, partial [Ascosphaera atra]